MKSFKCALITPQGIIFEGPATMVIAPGAEGQFGVLAGHEHIVSVLKKGVLKIKTEAGEQFFGLDSGVLEVDGNNEVVVLADKVNKGDSEADAKQKISDLETPVS